VGPSVTTVADKIYGPDQSSLISFEHFHVQDRTVTEQE
jgi:hypothetical protein